MVTVTELQKRIALLQRLIASERPLLNDPSYGIPAARVIAAARHELAVLRSQAITRRPVAFG